MNILPRLSEIERQSADSVAVRGELSVKVPSGARVKKDAIGLVPTRFTRPLTQIRKQLIQIGRIELCPGAETTCLQPLCIEFGVKDNGAIWTPETYVAFHARYQFIGVRILRNHLPLDDGCADTPAEGVEFTLEKVEYKFLKKLRQLFSDEVAEASGTTAFSGEPLLVDELADVEQKGVDSVVAMELHTPKMFRMKYDLPNRCEPAKQVMHVGTRGCIKFLRFVEPLKCGLQDAIRQRVVF